MKRNRFFYQFHILGFFFYFIYQSDTDSQTTHGLTRLYFGTRYFVYWVASRTAGLNSKLYLLLPSTGFITTVLLNLIK